MNKQANCEVYYYDEAKVHQIQTELEQVNMEGITQFFKLLGDEKRAKIAYSLCHDEELCVCDIANIIDSSIAIASHHLRTFLKQGIVKYRKEGKFAFYSLKDEDMKQLLTTALNCGQDAKATVK